MRGLIFLFFRLRGLWRLFRHPFSPRSLVRIGGMALVAIAIAALRDAGR